jgi:mono/diheme cytochrome c family protein
MQRTAFAAAITIGLAAATTAAADDEARRTTLGRITYGLSCAICHGPSGQGDGEFASSLTRSAPDLTRIAARHGGQFPEAYVTEVITGGAAVTTHGGQMPAWGLIYLRDFEQGGTETRRDDAALVKRRIEDLVIFLRSIQSTEQ